MKISLIVMSTSELVSSEKNNILGSIRGALYKNNQEVSSSIIIKSEPLVLKSNLQSVLNDVECVLIMVENSLDKPYMAKRIIASLFDDSMDVNDYARQNIEDYLRRFNVPMQKDDMTFAQMPTCARTIKNPYGVFQGCLCEKDGKMIFLLPLEHNELQHMFFASVLPYILQSKQSGSKAYVLKTFGIKYADMLLLLKDLINNKHGIEIVCNEYLGDGEIIITAPKSVRYDYVDNFVADVYSKVHTYVYTDKDENECECIHSLLSLYSKNIAFAEDFTAGNMASSMAMAIENVSSIMLESFVTISPESKMDILSLNKSVAFGKDYKEIAYNMAVGLMNRTGCDIAVATTGSVEMGEVTFAIGSSEGVHIFTYNVSGNREQKILSATGKVFFELIKKLKKNNFHIGEFIS